MSILVQIEHCKNCHLHQWNSRHDEIKYIDFYEQLTLKIADVFPQARVMERSPPANLLEKKTPATDGAQFIDIDTGEHVHFPRLGSFQVYVQGQRIFSKIKNKRWPKFDRVIQKIKLLIQALQTGEDIKKFDVDYVQITEAQMKTNKMLYDIQTIFRVRRNKYNQQHSILDQPVSGRYSAKKRQLNKSLDISRKHETILHTRAVHGQTPLGYSTLNPQASNSYNNNGAKPKWKDPQQKDYWAIKDLQHESINQQPFNSQKVYLQEVYPRSIVANYRKKKMTLNKIDNEHIVIENEDGEKEYFVKQAKMNSRRQTPNLNPRRKLKPIQDPQYQDKNNEEILETQPKKQKIIQYEQVDSQEKSQQAEDRKIQQIEEIQDKGQEKVLHKNLTKKSQKQESVEQNKINNVNDKDKDNEQMIGQKSSGMKDEYQQDIIILKDEQKIERQSDDKQQKQQVKESKQNDDKQIDLQIENQDNLMELQFKDQQVEESKHKDTQNQNVDQNRVNQQQQIHNTDGDNEKNEGNQQEKGKTENIQQNNSDTNMQLKYSTGENQVMTNHNNYQTQKRKQSVESGNNRSIDLGTLQQEQQHHQGNTSSNKCDIDKQDENQIEKGVQNQIDNKIGHKIDNNIKNKPENKVETKQDKIFKKTDEEQEQQKQKQQSGDKKEQMQNFINKNEQQKGQTLQENDKVSHQKQNNSGQNKLKQDQKDQQMFRKEQQVEINGENHKQDKKEEQRKQDQEQEVIAWETQLKGVEFHLCPSDQKAKEAQNNYIQRIENEEKLKIEKMNIIQVPKIVSKDKNIVEWEASFESHSFKLKKMI